MDWKLAVDALESELTACATQVLQCIRIQSIKPSPLK